MVSTVFLIIFISSVSVFAQKKQRVEEFPKGEQVSILIGGWLSGIKDVNVITRVYDAPYNKVWLAAKLTAEKLDKIGKRLLVLVDEKNGRTTNGVIDQNVLIGLGSGAWVDQFQIEVTSVSDNKTKVDITRKVVEKDILGGEHWKSQYSNSNIEKWVLTQIDDQINPAMMENTAVSKRNPTSVPVFAQKKQVESEKSAKAETADTLTNADIIQMAKQKLPDAIIIQKIKYSKCKFDTSPDALSSLNKSGVSEQIILAMMENIAVPKRNPTSVSVFAQKNQEEKKTKFGIGFQVSYPAWGISGMLDVTPNVSIQGILGPLGDLKTYAGRGIYKFKKGPYWNAYGYGMLGAWSYQPVADFYSGGLLYMGTKGETETIVGFGAGAGIEYDWRGLGAGFSDLPPIWWSTEIGLGKLDFKKSEQDYSGIWFGVGAHYRF